MHSAFKRYITLLFPFTLLAGCAPRLYQPPPLGAEHRLDEGLKPEKHPRNLFDKDMKKYLQQQGIERQEKPAKQVSATKQSHSATAQPLPSDSISRQPAAPDTGVHQSDVPDTTGRTPSTTPAPAK